MGIRDMVRTAGSPAILAVTAPKNDDSEQALGNQLFTALGLPLRGRWSERKPKLMGSMVQFGVTCLIVDDAHDLSLTHLMYIKELTDQGRLHYDYPLGLCLVTAGRGNTIPLKEIFDQPDTMWLQFRRRLDKLAPFCRVAGHTSEEVREILAALETVYRALLPQLNLRQWSGAIYTWLTQPVLDPTRSGRVTMDYLMKLVTTALEWSSQAGETDVKAETSRKPLNCLCSAAIRCRSLMAQDHGWQSLGQRAQNQAARMGPGSNGKRYGQTGSRTRRKRSTPRCNRAYHPNARLLGWLPSISHGLLTVASPWWNVLPVHACVRSPRTRASYDSHRTTDAKCRPL